MKQFDWNQEKMNGCAQNEASYLKKSFTIYSMVGCSMSLVTPTK